MPPQAINTNVGYVKLHQLSEEFTQHWKRLEAFYLDAVAGFSFVLSHVESEQEQARTKPAECSSSNRRSGLLDGALDYLERVSSYQLRARRSYLSGRGAG